MSEVVLARGHINIRASHGATLEFTKDVHLSKTGNCIIAVGTDKGVADLSFQFKETLRRPDAQLAILIEAGNMSEQVNASGSPRLTLAHLSDLVVRKSDYICSRTLAIRADKAARDLSRKFVQALKDPQQQVKITLTVSP
jgi:hypothetical protein